MVLFLYSGSEKGSSVTETPVIKKHNGLHLTLPDARDTDSGEETRFVLSYPKCMLLQERNVLFSSVRVGLCACCWAGGQEVQICLQGHLCCRMCHCGLSVPWLPHA